MGKFRSKLKGQTKGKRWAKGQSSSSNPVTTKHRDQAKSRFFQVNLGPSNLTTDALKKHDASQNFTSQSTAGTVKSATTAGDDNQSYVDTNSTYRTYDTYASDFSQCSNMSFSKLMTTFRSDSALHKNMLAVLAAVTDVIKSNGGQETSTEYYAALMTTLEVADTEEIQASVLSLISMGIKTVPQSVLRLQFGKATQMYLQILAQTAESDNNVIIRSILNILAVFLRAQEQAAWNEPSTIHVFDTILAFVNHTKPKIRKPAQNAICGILNASCFMLDDPDEDMKPINKVTHHPIGAHVAKFCIKGIETSVGSTGGQTTTLHTLGLLKDCIQTFPKNYIKLTCETILKIMTLNNPLVNSCSLQVLHSLFSGQKTNLPSTLNDQLIGALYDYQPSAMDSQPTLAWLAVMKQAHSHLADVDIETCMKRLPKMFETVSQLLLTDRREIISSATLVIDDLIKDCIGAATDHPEKVTKFENQLKQCFGIIEHGLGYQFHSAWSHVLHLINTIFDIAGSNCRLLLTPYLKTLSSLRDSYKFSYNNELEQAVGAAIKSMGPEIVLQEISLTNANGGIILDRSWLLPVLKDCVRNSTLEYFNSNIRNLAESCEKKSKELFSKKDSIGGHSMELFSVQLWSLFPSFCNSPKDIATNLKKIAQVIGIRLTNSKDFRLPLFAGLRKLINYAQDPSNPTNYEDLQELSRFAKNYIPIFFNIYTTQPKGSDEEGQRLAALDTIRVYLQIAPDELRQTLFKEAVKRLDANEENFIRESIFDLVRMLSIYQDCEALEALYKQIITDSKTLSKNQKEHKKTYRLFEEVCGSDKPGCLEFVRRNKKLLRGLFLKTLESTTPSSRAARLKCLNLLLFRAHSHIDPDNKLVREALAESILYMKDINERCRAEAQKLLLAIGEALMKTTNGRDQFLGSIMAGYAGSQQMLIGSILSLATIIHHFSGTLGIENLELLLKTNLQLLESNNREVVQAILSFVKVFLQRIPLPIVNSHLPQIVQQICAMNEDTRRHFRVKLRNILDRLIRKFGCDTISKLVPSNDIVMHKRIRNLRKLNSRKKRQREQGDEVEDNTKDFTVQAKPKTIDDILADSDSEIEEQVEDKQQNRKKGKSSAWIQDNEESIVDFTDTATVSKIRATKPTAPTFITKEKKKDRGFKTASDGRLLITEDSDDSENDNKKRNKIDLDSDSEDDDGKSAATLKLGTVKRKRAASETMSVFSGTSSNHPPAMKYQAGGSGIHRSVKKSAASEAGSIYKSNKASGDVKRKGKVDPYAYLPLKRSALNKRKRLKSAGEFKNIVRGATKGAKKGMKAKKNRR